MGAAQGRSRASSLRADGPKSGSMLVTTANGIDGRSVSANLGLVRGIVVRSPTIAQGVLGGLKQFVGGNIESYAEVCEHAREQAFERMAQHAVDLGADAVIAVRYDATPFGDGATEVLCYGTAVKLASSRG